MEVKVYYCLLSTIVYTEFPPQETPTLLTARTRKGTCVPSPTYLNHMLLTTASDNMTLWCHPYMPIFTTLGSEEGTRQIWCTEKDNLSCISEDIKSNLALYLQFWAHAKRANLSSEWSKSLPLHIGRCTNSFSFTLAGANAIVFSQQGNLPNSSHQLY